MRSSSTIGVALGRAAVILVITIYGSGVSIPGAHAAPDDSQDVPSTLSPRATKEPPPTAPTPAPPTSPSDAPAPKPVRRQPTQFELVMKRASPELVRRVGRDKELLTTGRLLVGVGSAALLASTVVWSIYIGAPPEKPMGASVDPAFNYKVGGIVTIVVGGLFALPGIGAWAVGEKRFKKSSAEIEKIVEDIKREEAARKAGEASAPAPASAPEVPTPPPAPAVPVEPVPSDRPLFQ